MNQEHSTSTPTADASNKATDKAQNHNSGHEAHGPEDHNPKAPTTDAHNDGADPTVAMAQRMIAPAVSMGLTWAARKAMTSAYEKKTGTQPPTAGDTNIPIGKVLLWSAGMAVVTTLIDTVVSRIASKKLPDQNS